MPVSSYNLGWNKVYLAFLHPKRPKKRNNKSNNTTKYVEHVKARNNKQKGRGRVTLGSDKRNTPQFKIFKALPLHAYKNNTQNCRDGNKGFIK